MKLKLNLNLNNARFEITAVDRNSIRKMIYRRLHLWKIQCGKIITHKYNAEQKKSCKSCCNTGENQGYKFLQHRWQTLFCRSSGYGFAKVPKTMKTGWKDIIENLSYRKKTAEESNHAGGYQAFADFWRRAYAWMAESYEKILCGCSYQTWQNTTHKNKERISDIRSILKLEDDVKIIPFSSETRQGRDECGMKFWMNHILLNHIFHEIDNFDFTT